MLKAARTYFISLRFEADNSKKTAVANPLNAAKSRLSLEKISTISLINYAFASSQELLLPPKTLQRPKDDALQAKVDQTLIFAKILAPVDIKSIQDFAPRSQKDVPEAVWRARHALLNENPEETNYFIPDVVSEMLKKAHVIDPGNLDIEFWRGLCARRQVRFPREKEMSQRARHHLAKVLHAYPDHRDVKAHYAAALWVQVKENNIYEYFPSLMITYSKLAEGSRASLFSHTLAAKRDSYLRLVTGKGLQEIEGIAEENPTNIPIQSFLLCAYYDCFESSFTQIRQDLNKKGAFDSIYKKVVSCIGNLKLLDPTSLIVEQIECQLRINGKEPKSIYLSGPRCTPRVDGFFYDMLWRQDPDLEFGLPLQPSAPQA